MGLLVDGIWRDKWYETESQKGRFVRAESRFRNWVTADGSAGPSGEGGFNAEAGRYHLYVSYACPWAHRALIYLAVKGLERKISISVVNWHMGERGWTFEPGPGVVPDPIYQAKTLADVYSGADPKYSGRVTVPVLWDKQRNTIVNNESSEIIRMLNDAFDDLGANPGDYYAKDLRPVIVALNERVYGTVNNGVYKAGFATTQTAYEEALHPLFETLDWLEQRLASRRYLCGERLTEADWRLFTTLLRFDPVYVGHFKCNIRRIADYRRLSAYLRDLLSVPGVRATVHLDHIKNHYYGSHKTINPTGIVPVGPMLDWA
jgi:putative glutathione S-transferase